MKLSKVRTKKGIFYKASQYFPCSNATYEQYGRTRQEAIRKVSSFCERVSFNYLEVVR